MSALIIVKDKAEAQSAHEKGQAFLTAYGEWKRDHRKADGGVKVLPAAGAMAPEQPVSFLPDAALQTASHGIRILLAEDDAINRARALRLLEKRGYSVELAANGREALALLREKAVNLVLMDVQIPEMDGFAAAREIRRGELETGMHVPIIAITAPGIKSDRDKCLEAGMDDYLAKPINKKTLYAKIDEWLGDPGGRTTLHALVEERPEEKDAMDEALDRLGGDRALFSELTSLFEQEAPGLLEQGTDALDRQDWALLQRAAHSLKGAASQVGADSVCRAARELEEAAAAFQVERAKSSLSMLATEIGRSGQLMFGVSGR